MSIKSTLQEDVSELTFEELTGIKDWVWLLSDVLDIFSKFSLFAKKCPLYFTLNFN